MTTVKKLKDDLDYWIHIGIGDDIVTAPESRPEYQHLVKYLKSREVKEERIPACALFLMKKELERSVICQTTFWVLICLHMKWGCKWLFKKGNQGLRMLAGKKEV